MKRLMGLVLLGAMAMAPLLAKGMAFRAGFVKYSAPDDWKVLEDKSEGQRLTNGDGDLSLFVRCFERDRGLNSRHCLENLAAEKMTDVKYKDEGVQRVNDLIQYHLSGTGKPKGSDKTVEFSACWVQVEGEDVDLRTVTANTVFWFQGDSILDHRHEGMGKVYESIAQDK